MDLNDLSHAHDETGIIPIILNALLINEKQENLIFFNIALTLSGKFDKRFSQLCSRNLSFSSNDLKL